MIKFEKTIIKIPDYEKAKEDYYIALRVFKSLFPRTKEIDRNEDI